MKISYHTKKMEQLKKNNIEQAIFEECNLLNPLSLGAIGNGTVDDTLALQTTLDLAIQKKDGCCHNAQSFGI